MGESFGTLLLDRGVTARAAAWVLALELARRWAVRVTIAPGPGWRGLLLWDGDHLIGRVTAHGDIERADGSRLVWTEQPLSERLAVSARHLATLRPRTDGVWSVVLLEVVARLVIGHHPEVAVFHEGASLRLTSADRSLVLAEDGAVRAPPGRGSLVERWLAGDTTEDLARWLAFELALTGGSRPR